VVFLSYCQNKAIRLAKCELTPTVSIEQKVFAVICFKESNREPGIHLFLKGGGKANGGFNRRGTIMIVALILESWR
jgi:hypothetical protein